MLVEYRNQNGKNELRDDEVGRIEAELRRHYLSIILPVLSVSLSQEFGPIFQIKIVGSTALNMAKPESDIDLLVKVSEKVSKHIANLFAVAFYRAINEITTAENSYKIDAWFGEEIPRGTLGID